MSIPVPSPVLKKLQHFSTGKVASFEQRIRNQPHLVPDATVEVVLERSADIDDDIADLILRQTFGYKKRVISDGATAAGVAPGRCRYGRDARTRQKTRCRR